jgi:hypothetical protein
MPNIHLKSLTDILAKECYEKMMEVRNGFPMEAFLTERLADLFLKELNRLNRKRIKNSNLNHN